MAREPGPTEVVRSRTGQALGLAVAVTALVAMIVVTTEGVESLLHYGAAAALFGFLGWAAFWQPHVEVSDGGVRVANTWRTVHVPWPALEAVEGRYGLRLRTAYGVVTAWGAPAPAGRQRARGDSGSAADRVTARLEELRAAGYLDDAVLERPRPVVVWHRATIAVAAVLLLAAVVLPLLG
jgi:hypothetical protein